MDYEKKYKEMKARVLEIGRGYVKGVDFSKPRQIAEYIDPELVESEDERIREALVRFHKSTIDIDGIKGEDIIAWLEKQGEQEPAWSEEDEQLIDEVVVCLRKYAEKVQGGYSKSYVQSLADRIESLRPGNTCKATEWSDIQEMELRGFS